MQTLMNWSILASVFIIFLSGFIAGYVWRLLLNGDLLDPNAVEQTDADGTSVGDRLNSKDVENDRPGGVWTCEHGLAFLRTSLDNCPICDAPRPS